ncbi:hypothetical protein EMCG_06512 [[Emmonsia] crescens]|uniref:F-box domain-containing protein n=1 Tax=[Emmonsia] crescens TaxID=73230 RepID=A0A0G2IC17_9EURO|nr:hypothetical protein EMCG_06512 [Emmonsia crescens UAMH 3008]
MSDNNCKLPVELLEQIAQNMNKEDLKIFMKASRMFRSVVEPILYKTISLTRPATAVLTLLRAIHERPRMVSRTETLDISETEEEIIDVMKLVHIAGLDTQSTVNQIISHLLSKLPNLRSFHLHSLRGNSGIAIYRVDRKPLDLSSLRKIVTLQLSAHCLFTCLSSTPVLPLTLERLHVKDADSVDGENLTKVLVNYVKQKPVEGADAWALKFISIDSMYCYWMLSGDELRAICDDRGVDLEPMYQKGLLCGCEPFGK